jgi:elongation factor 3
MKVTDEEKVLMGTAIQWLETNEETGKQTKSMRIVQKLTGERTDAQRRGQEDEYECKWKLMSNDSNSWLSKTKLERMGWAKHVAQIDLKITQQEGMYKRPLTTSNVETHLINVGLGVEAATHTRIGALSGGENVKVVLGASLWMCPHLIILDEPTNYLDRESLGALAGAIEKFEGGVVIISHNDEFCQQLCPETWVVERSEDGISRPNIQGDAEWMANALSEKVDDTQVVQEMVDAAGNVTATKQKKKLSKKDMKKMKAKVSAKVEAGLELDSDEEEFAFEHDL